MTRLNKNITYCSNPDATVNNICNELREGLKLLTKVDKKIITIFGSHRMKKDNPYYVHCKNLAYRLGKNGFAVFTGGGTGIMHAANSGVTEAGGLSFGLRAKLLKDELVADPIFTDKLDFHFLFTRKFIMTLKSEALVFYPGGYGTLSELFECLVAIQTKLVDRVPIICVDRKYWKNLIEWIEKKPLKNELLINGSEDVELIHFADTPGEIISIIERLESAR